MNDARPHCRNQRQLQMATSPADRSSSSGFGSKRDSATGDRTISVLLERSGASSAMGLVLAERGPTIPRTARSIH